MNQDILEGLRNALLRGDSIKKAMMSFHNAGYKKQEIEEAARALQENTSPVRKVISQKPEKPIKKPLTLKYQPTQSKKEKSTTQVVSKYQEKPKGKLALIFVIIALVIILLGLVASYIFQKELISFFKNLF